MAVQLSRKPFGDYSLIRIGNETSHISFVPEKSGYIHQIRLMGRDLLWNYENGEALTINKGHRNLALLPFPNRLLEGQYNWLGESLHFEVNKPDTRSALHGYGPDAAFSLSAVNLSKDKAFARLKFLNRPSDHQGQYPFLVEFELELGVNMLEHRASWQLRARNLGATAVPVGLGWHPYFLLPGGKEKWRLYMPPNQEVALEHAIPTGNMKEGLPPKQALSINETWDSCFALSTETDRTVRLAGPDYNIHVTQTGETRYTQLYVPPDQGSLAIEPMSCGVNAFQVAVSEVRIPPRESISIGLHIELSQDI